MEPNYDVSPSLVEEIFFPTTVFVGSRVWRKKISRLSSRGQPFTVNHLHERTIKAKKAVCMHLYVCVDIFYYMLE